MRICYVTARLPFGEGETFVTTELLELRRRGIPLLVVPLKPGRSSAHDDARSLIPFTVAAPLLSPRVLAAAAAEALSHPLRCARAFRAILRSRSASMLGKNLAVFPKGLWLSRLLRRRGASHLHAHWAGTTSTMALVAAEVSGVPWSFTAHRWDIDENNLVEAKGESARFVRAIDVRGGEELAVYLGAQRGKLRVIHMGVRLPGPDATAIPAPPVPPLRVIMAAEFVEKKGHRYAIEAVHALAERGVDVVLDLAGTAPAVGRAVREEADRLVASRGLADRVRFLGVMPHDELLAGMLGGRWHVALLPSVVASNGEKEGIPVFLMEAMAAGMPVVATENGGIPELITPDSGLLVPERDPAAIAEALERLSRDPALRAQVGRRATVRVREGFARETVAAELLRAMDVEDLHGAEPPRG